jgi:hypothetical protein
MIHAPGPSPALQRLLLRQFELTPAHEPFLRKRIALVDAEEAILLEEIAGVIVAMAGDALDHCCLDYDWLAKTVLEEELHFRRTGGYRLQTLEQAIEQERREAARNEHLNNLIKGKTLIQ